MAFRDGLAVAVQAVVVGTFHFSMEASKLPDIEILDDLFFFRSAILMLRTLAVYGRDLRIIGLFVLLAIGATALSVVCLYEAPP